jgi:hypothetical protein
MEACALLPLPILYVDVPDEGRFLVMVPLMHHTFTNPTNEEFIALQPVDSGDGILNVAKTYIYGYPYNVGGLMRIQPSVQIASAQCKPVDDGARKFSEDYHHEVSIHLQDKLVRVARWLVANKAEQLANLKDMAQPRIDEVLRRVLPNL